MISKRFVKQKGVRIALIIISFAFILYLATFLDGAYEQYSKASDNQLVVVNSTNLPITELSGLFLNHSSKELIAIGDNSATVSVAHIDDNLQLAIQPNININPAILNQFALCDSDQIPECHRLKKKHTSQWEAIAAVYPSNIYLLNEQLSTIFIYNKELNKISSVINLESYELNKANLRERITVDQANAMGEGFVLLKNGHILVAKERFAPTLVEFAPERNQTPLGYQSKLILPSDMAFPLADNNAHRHIFYPIKVWKIPSKFRHCDLSELSASATGELYLLSQQCQWIGKLNNLDPTAQEVSFKEFWSLPKNFKQAEAFVVWDEKTFIVGEDLQSEKRANLFILMRQNREIQSASTPTS